MKPTAAFHRITGLKLSPVKQHASSDGKPFWCRDLIVTGDDGTPFRLGLYTLAGPEAIIVDAAEEMFEAARAEVAAQMKAEDAEAARLAEKARVADPGYVPTLAEAMRNPAEPVAGMIEEGPVHHTSLPPGLEMNYQPHYADDTPPPAPEWKPEDYARCVNPDIGKRLTVGRVYQVEAVHPVVVTGQPGHPPMLRLRDAESGPFSADRFERCDVPF